MIELSKSAGRFALDAYEKALQSMLDFQESRRGHQPTGISALAGPARITPVELAARRRPSPGSRACFAEPFRRRPGRLARRSSTTRSNAFIHFFDTFDALFDGGGVDLGWRFAGHNGELLYDRWWCLSVCGFVWLSFFRRVIPWRAVGQALTPSRNSPPLHWARPGLAAGLI